MSRRKHTSDFKKKVALEAIREQKTINQIAKEFQVHPAQVSAWRKQLLDGLDQFLMEAVSKNPMKIR